MVEVALSSDEDSVTSLAVAQSNETSATVFAGINSSNAQQQAGKNEHFRSFRLGYPPRKRKDGSTEDEKQAVPETRALSKVSLFHAASGAKKESYQRVLRLSPINRDSGARIGAVATGLAPEGEVVVFEARKTSPDVSDILKRIQLKKGEEAADVDLIENNGGDHLVAYCTDYEVYLYKHSATDTDRSTEPLFIHGTPHPDVFANKQRPTFRFLRFLTPSLLLLLQNLPSRKGVALLLLSVPQSRNLGEVLLVKKLPSALKAATAFSTALLPSASPSQNIQHVIAIGGQDISLTILTLDHDPNAPNPTLRFRTHTTLQAVHPLQMTALTFSSFTIPPNPAKASPQYLKLASCSMANTLVVHTLPLTLDPPPSAKSKTKPRYVLQSATSELAQTSFSILISIVVIAIGAFLLQAWTEIRGGTPEYLGAKGWLSQRVHDYVALPYMFADSQAPVVPSVMPAVESLRERIPSKDDVKEKVEQARDAALNVEELRKPGSLRRLLWLRQRTSSTSENGEQTDGSAAVAKPRAKALVISHDGEALSTELHHDEGVAMQKGKKWEELKHEERESWKRRLVDAGEWAVEEGETVLKGVFFSEVAGFVGGVVGGLAGNG